MVSFRRAPPQATLNMSGPRGSSELERVRFVFAQMIGKTVQVSLHLHLPSSHCTTHACVCREELPAAAHTCPCWPTSTCTAHTAVSRWIASLMWGSVRYMVVAGHRHSETRARSSGNNCPATLAHARRLFHAHAPSHLSNTRTQTFTTLQVQTMNGVVYQGILSGTNVGSSPVAQIGVSLEMAYKKHDAKGTSFACPVSLSRCTLIHAGTAGISKNRRDGARRTPILSPSLPPSPFSSSPTWACS